MTKDGASVTGVPVLSPLSGKTHSHVISYQPGRVSPLFDGKQSPDQASKRQKEIMQDAFALAECLPGGKIIIPVSARAMIGDENADRVLSILRSIDDDMRQRVIVEMHDLPRQLSLDAVEIATIPFLLFVGGFIARVGPEVEDATVFANCNYLGLSADMTHKPEERNVMRDVWALAAPRRLKIFAWNVTSEDVVEDARRMEVFGCTRLISNN